MRPWTWQEASILIVGCSIALVAVIFIGIWNRRGLASRRRRAKRQRWLPSRDPQ